MKQSVRKIVNVFFKKTVPPRGCFLISFFGKIRKMYLLFIFLFGLFIGSFLNALLYRLDKEESVLKGRSFCPSCRHTLAWFDLIPVLSWLYLKGKCRYCGKKISVQYLAVEVSTAFLFALAFLRFEPSGFFNFLIFSYYLALICFLIVIFIYDLRTYLILDKVIYPAILFVLFFKIFFVFQDYLENTLLVDLMSALGAAGFFFFLVVITKGQGMGMGDVKLAFFMGLLLGWPQIIVALFLSFFVGSVVGVGLVSLNKKGWKSQVPFGPFLAGATILMIFYGNYLTNLGISLII